MTKAPRELTKQIEVFEGVIDSLNDIIDLNKIKTQNYGKDFQEPLAKLREEALALRSSRALQEFFGADFDRAVLYQRTICLCRD